MHIVDLATGVSPAGSFRYLSIAVQLVEPGVRIRLQHTAEANEMALRVNTAARKLGASNPYRRWYALCITVFSTAKN